MILQRSTIFYCSEVSETPLAPMHNVCLNVSYVSVKRARKPRQLDFAGDFWKELTYEDERLDLCDWAIPRIELRDIFIFTNE